MRSNIWIFMETECRNPIKKPFKISLSAAVGLSEPFFMLVMTVKPYNPSPAAVETGIVQHASKINQISGYKNRWKSYCLPIIPS